MPVQTGLLVGARGQLSLEAVHPGEHAVEGGEGIGCRGGSLEGGVGGGFEVTGGGGALFLGGVAGGAQIGVEELVGEADEGLVLKEQRGCKLAL